MQMKLTALHPASLVLRLANLVKNHTPNKRTRLYVLDNLYQRCRRTSCPFRIDQQPLVRLTFFLVKGFWQRQQKH